MQDFVEPVEMIKFVGSRGYCVERIFNTTEMKLDGTPVRVVGFDLLGPRGNKTFVPMNEDGLVSMFSAKLWCDGVDYSTAEITKNKEFQKSKGTQA